MKRVALLALLAVAACGGGHGAAITKERKIIVHTQATHSAVIFPAPLASRGPLAVVTLTSRAATVRATNTTKHALDFSPYLRCTAPHLLDEEGAVIYNVQPGQSKTGIVRLTGFHSTPNCVITDYSMVRRANL